MIIIEVVTNCIVNIILKITSNTFDYQYQYKS